MRRQARGAIANYKAALRDIKRRRAKGLPVNPEYAAKVDAAASGRPEPVRPWWADRDEEDEPMEVIASGEYRGEPFKITADGAGGVRRVVTYTRKAEADALAFYHQLTATLSGVKYEHVRNRKTGD